MDQRSPGGDLLLPRLPGPINIPAKFAPSTRSVVVVSSIAGVDEVSPPPHAEIIKEKTARKIEIFFLLLMT